MQNTKSSPTSKVERDSRLFVWFMTIVLIAMYALTLKDTPAVRQPALLIIFTTLMSIHIALHWQLEKTLKDPLYVIGYVIAQGLLALGIAWIAANIAMTFAIFMALLGEAVGLYGLTRRGIMASVYYLALLVVNLVELNSWEFSGMLFLSIVPMAIFVVIYVTLYMRQSDAREQAEKLAQELDDANRQLAEYAAQVEDLSIANERQRMARELHDTLSQGLAGIILQLEATEIHLGSNRIEKAQNIISDAKTQARATLADARNAIDDLRQTALDDLDSALRLEVSRFTNATGIPVSYHADQTPPLPDSVQETIVRTVAESLTNIARHAQASEVAVSLSLAEHSLLVSMQDNGQGFDPQNIPAGHYGILGIRERVRLANGEVNIQSEKNKGTNVEVKFPLPLGEG